MSRLEIENRLEIYEIDGDDIGTADEDKKLIVRSHWNRREFVVIELEKDRSVTVVADDLKDAIQNATNWSAT
jgi:hypothetical protein